MQSLLNHIFSSVASHSERIDPLTQFYFCLKKKSFYMFFKPVIYEMLDVL